VLHADVGKPLTIGERRDGGPQGHAAWLHIGDDSLIGIGAVVLNGARIGKGCLVGAGALVTEGKEFPDGSMIIGSPAKAVRQLTPEQLEGLRQSAESLHCQCAPLQGGCTRLPERNPCVSEIHKFLFDGLPVRGMLVRLTDAWTEILRRRASNTAHGAYPRPCSDLLGEMTAAAVLMQSNIKFNGALVLQVFGDGPVKLAVVEVQPDLACAPRPP
jgi:hypothetical protein